MLDLPILRTSERSAFKRCVWRWRKEFVEGYRPRGSRQADAAWLGIGIHIGLAEWYQKGTRRGPHPADTFQNWADDEIRYVKTYADETFDEGAWEDATDLGIAMLENYVNHYGTDPQWYVIATEHPFKIRIHRQGKPVAYFQSRWDGVVRFNGKIYLLEHKTAAQIFLPYLEIDDQGGSYFAVASAMLRAQGILKPNEPIAGIIYNFLRKTSGDDREQNEEGQYLNKDGNVSKRQPPPPFVRETIFRSRSEQRTQLERIADEIAVMNAVRDGTIPVTKTPTKDCPHCPFWTPCTLDERGSDSVLSVLKADFIKHDPYADNRKSA
jgi:Zierdtviridae exonuclease